MYGGSDLVYFVCETLLQMLLIVVAVEVLGLCMPSYKLFDGIAVGALQLYNRFSTPMFQ